MLLLSQELNAPSIYELQSLMNALLLHVAVWWIALGVSLTNNCMNVIRHLTLR